MTHSATTRTNMAWNKPGSLGFLISQRHTGVGLASRSPLIQERTGGLRKTFQRHEEFAGRALARMAARSFPDSHASQHSRNMEFIHLADRIERPRNPAAGLATREPPIMRYPSTAALTGLDTSGVEKSGSAPSGVTASAPMRGAEASHPKREDIGVARMAPVQQVQQVQRVYVARRSIHDESSLSDSAVSRARHDDSAASSGSPRDASVSTHEAHAGNERFGKQEEIALSPVFPESRDAPAVLTRAPVMPDIAASANTELRSLSGNTSRFTSRFTSPASATAAASVMQRLSSGIAGQRSLLSPDRRIPGISRISTVSGIVERQAGGFEATRIQDANRYARNHIGIHGGIHGGIHVKPEGVKAEGPLSYQGKLPLHAMGTHWEAPGAKPDPKVSRAEPERNVQVIRTGPQSGSANDGLAGSDARSTVLSRQPVTNASIFLQAHEVRNEEKNAVSIIGKAAASEKVDVPDSRAMLARADSAGGSIVPPAVLPASSSAIHRSTAVQKPHNNEFMSAHHHGMSFPLQSRSQSRPGLAMRSMGRDTRSRMMRSSMLERAADPMAKDQGNRHGHFPVVHASPDAMRAVDRVNGIHEIHGAAPAVEGGRGGGGKEEHFLAQAPGLAGDTLSARGMSGISGISGMGPQRYLDRPSNLAGLQFLSGGISRREPIHVGLMGNTGADSGITGECRPRDAALRRAAIAGPVTASGSSPPVIPAIHDPAAGAGEPRPAAMPSPHGYREVMQRKPDFASAGSSTLSPVSRISAMPVAGWRTSGDGMDVQRAASFDFEEGKPASLRAARDWAYPAAFPLVRAYRLPQVPQVQRMEAGMGEGEAALGRIMRLIDDATGAATHSLPLARQEAPEDRYGVVPAPHLGPGGIRVAPHNEVAAAESSVGKPDADEMAEQTWRLISERLVIEQERRGLAQWSR